MAALSCCGCGCCWVAIGLRMLLDIVIVGLGCVELLLGCGCCWHGKRLSCGCCWILDVVRLGFCRIELLLFDGALVVRSCCGCWILIVVVGLGCSRRNWVVDVVGSGCGCGWVRLWLLVWVGLMLGKVANVVGLGNHWVISCKNKRALIYQVCDV